jgi:hypothetical protein
VSVISGVLTAANITILYLLPFLIIIYVIFIFHSFIGSFHGAKYTQEKWTRFTGTYYEMLAKRMGKK